MHKQFNFMVSGWEKWKSFMEQLISKLALVGMYFIGIGLTSLVGKVFQRQFLTRNFQTSSWQPITGSQKITRMF